MKQTKAPARRQRIQAFGEWNYGYDDVVAGDPAAVVTQSQHYYDSAVMQMQMQMQAGRLVMAIPPSPHKPASANNKVVKWRGSVTPTLDLDDEKKHKHQHVEGEHGGAVKKQGKQQSHAYKQACRVVKAMDQDLYHIPPDMLCHDPRKRLTRRRSGLWMGCLGLNCVVA